MQPDESTVREFLRRLGHRVALIGRKPVADAPKSTVLWPADIDDPPDAACWLSRQYHAVYCNLNPLAAHMLEFVPPVGKSISDNMIARRTRLLIDVDGHDGSKEIARQQKDGIKARFGEPIIEADSGNGFGLIYEIPYANDAESKHRIKMLLQQLNLGFPNVDVSTFNAGRLTRVIGTLNKSVVTGERIPTELLN